MKASLRLIVAALICAATMACATSEALAAPPKLAVKGASLSAGPSGQRLYGVNANKHMLIASTTKLMTVRVVLQHVHNLSQKFTMPNWRAEAIDSQVGVLPGQKMTVHDLLIALMLPSADDAAIDLAYNVGHGSIKRFVGMMNAEAAKLGLKNTHYQNPIGLDGGGANYSTPYELTRLAELDMSYSPWLAKTVASPQATVKVGSHSRVVTNRNTLVGRIPWINGVKTGHTNAAGYIVVASGTQHGMTLFDSVLGTTSESARDANALALLKYGFANFRLAAPLKSGKVVKRLAVSEEKIHPAVIPARAWSKVVPKADQVSVRLKLPKQLSGPLKRHAKVGDAEVYVNGHKATAVPLLVQRAVPSAPVLKQVAHFVTKPTTLGVLALVVGAAVTAGGIRRRRPRAVVGRSPIQG
ncbi:MAG: D-alanyl-D-alanine carboxypeptidase [Solirubrobacterales bacterium]|nr:D-alanyl-D-alanine carboxypeptidase [Solirubrobacterales bacterium]